MAATSLPFQAAKPAGTADLAISTVVLLLGSVIRFKVWL
jgi:hypothetical protein